jgi:two-component system sensor histidine kinase YesM
MAKEDGVMARKVKKKKSFKDIIRRTLVVYALIPVAIITLASFLTATLIFYITIINVNRHANTTSSQKFEKTCMSYMEIADRFCDLPNTIDCVERGSANVELFQQLYEYVNTQDIHCGFYLLDDRQQPLSASSSLLPAYIRSTPIFNIGIIRKLKKTPGEVRVSVEANENLSKKVLTIGKAVLKDGRYLGALVFEFDEQDFIDIFLGVSPVKVFVTDRYDYVCWQNYSLLVNKFGKIDSAFQEHSGFISALDTSFYCSRSQVLGGAMQVYTVTEISNYNSIFAIVGLVLILIFSVLALSVIIASRVIADNKTHVIDEIVETMSHVRDEQLGCPLVLNTGDEFEQIAESYNQMLYNLRRLMEDKEEITRQNILSEIKQLETQFDPHFLFNTLELIKYMTKMDPNNVGKVIIGFSNLLRDSLDNTLSRLALCEDIRYTKNYLLIQKFRLGDKFGYSFDMQPEALDCIVPKRIIQPIVENAIIYGVDRRSVFHLNVEASFKDGDLVIVIEDNGRGIEPEKLKEIHEILKKRKNTSVHNGMYNIHRRIGLIYGERYGLSIDSVHKQGTRITIVLPIQKGVWRKC